MDSTRQKKISRLIQKELAEIFRSMGPEIIHGTMVTVTTVRVSPDLSVARVYLSFFPSGEAEENLASVTDKRSRIRHALGLKVKNQLRIIPELAFFIDDSLDYIDKIDSLLKPE